MMDILTMDNQTGIYRVTTLSGSVYEVDLDNRVLRRAPGEDAASLREDEGWIDLISWAVMVGERGLFFLRGLADDGIVTRRDTTPIVSIEEIK